MVPSMSNNFKYIDFEWSFLKSLLVNLLNISRTLLPEILYPITGDFTIGVKFEYIVSKPNKSWQL